MIKAFYVVYNTLGFGFLEKVYENALVHELGKTQLAVKQQERVDVRYDGILVGEYFADVVVENLVLLELKSSKQLIDKDEARLLNYLKATLHDVASAVRLLSIGTRKAIRLHIHPDQEPLRLLVLYPFDHCLAPVSASVVVTISINEVQP